MIFGGLANDGIVIQCVALANMPFDHNGQHATGNLVTFQDGSVAIEYEGDDYDYSPKCRYLYECKETGTLVSEYDNKHYDTLFIVRDIVKNYRRGLIIHEELVAEFKTLDIPVCFMDNWISRLEEYRLI